MDLFDYLTLLKKNDSTFRDGHFAKKVGIDKGHLSKIKFGLIVPTYKIAQKIEEASGGMISATELMKTCQEKADKRKLEE